MTSKPSTDWRDYPPETDPRFLHLPEEFRREARITTDNTDPDATFESLGLIDRWAESRGYYREPPPKDPNDPASTNGLMKFFFYGNMADPKKLQQFLGCEELPFTQETEGYSHRLVPVALTGKNKIFVHRENADEISVLGIFYRARSMDEKRKIYTLLTPSTEFFPVWTDIEDEEMADELGLAVAWIGNLEDLPHTINS